MRIYRIAQQPSFQNLLQSPKAAYLHAVNDLHDRFEEGEDIISKDSHYSYYYAIDIFHGRFEKGEDAISKSAEYSYRYAMDIIKGRWEKGEKTVSESPQHSYYYARDVLENRFEKGEEAISKNPEYSCRYAKDILQDRFPKGEEAISKSAEDSYYYAKDVLHGRFEKGEDAISKDEELFERYKKTILEPAFKIQKNVQKTLEEKQKQEKEKLERQELEQWKQESDVGELLAKNNNWYKIASRSVKEHIEDVVQADLNSPILITENYEIIDGAHRTAKAYILSKKIDAIILTQDEIDKTRLPKGSKYEGQIYRDDDKNEHSVTQLIELYGEKPTNPFDPKIILNQSKNVWGKIKIVDIIKQVIKLIKNKKSKTANK